MERRADRVHAQLHPRPHRRAALAVVVSAAVALGAVGAFAMLRPMPAESGALYFTVFRHPALYRADFTFAGGRPSFSGERRIIALPGSDGIAFEAGGRLVVGGQGTGRLEQVDLSTGAVRSEPTGCPGAFLLALEPSAHTVYTAGLPGPLCSAPVDPLARGNGHPLRGSDTAVNTLAFVPGGQVFYTASPPDGTGDFGTIDLRTGTTTRRLSQIPAGHTVIYDPYSKSLFVFGGDTIDQIHPAHPSTVVSSMSVPGMLFDSGTTDGHGHLLVASNTGQLVVVDYHLTDRIGSARNRVTVVPLRRDLVAVAPLVGPGSLEVTSIQWAVWAATGLVGVLLVSLAALVWPRRRAGTAKLPSWDVRRQEAERRHGEDRRRQRTEWRTGPRPRT